MGLSLFLLRWSIKNAARFAGGCLVSGFILQKWFLRSVDADSVIK